VNHWENLWAFSVHVCNAADDNLVINQLMVLFIFYIHSKQPYAEFSPGPFQFSDSGTSISMAVLSQGLLSCVALRVLHSYPITSSQFRVFRKRYQVTRHSAVICSPWIAQKRSQFCDGKGKRQY